MSTIWSDAILNQYASDSLQQINTDVPCIFHKFYFASVVGQSVYTLPDKVVSVKRVTWRGRELYNLSWEELQIITPATVVVTGSGDTIEGVIGRPMWYALHPTNIRDIRLYPSPDEAFLTTGDPYSQEPNEARFCISCMATIDNSDVLRSLPEYIQRRTVKAYVLWKCFEKEGPGQDLKASALYQSKYRFLIQRFKEINNGCFVSKKYSLEDTLSIDYRKYPRPILGPRFERVVY